ncbi:hypothetical protein [Streptomyces sp. NPDC059874]|uniref:hypothetical protein n=1 Tax=Streptomyces sp. NPDC059874 TaxID=3346983 RepID=UPI003659F039
MAPGAASTGDAELRRCALDAAWPLLVARLSAAAAVLPAVLGHRAAPYADRLAALLDGTVGDHARWALTRIGDPRALPGHAGPGLFPR